MTFFGETSPCSFYQELPGGFSNCRWSPDTGYYIGSIPNLPGAHTQVKTLDKLNKNLKEVVELCLEELTEEELAALPEFIGSQQIQIAV